MPRGHTARHPLGWPPLLENPRCALARLESPTFGTFTNPNALRPQAYEIGISGQGTWHRNF